MPCTSGRVAAQLGRDAVAHCVAAVYQATAMPRPTSWAASVYKLPSLTASNARASCSSDRRSEVATRRSGSFLVRLTTRRLPSTGHCPAPVYLCAAPTAAPPSPTSRGCAYRGCRSLCTSLRGRSGSHAKQRGVQAARAMVTALASRRFERLRSGFQFPRRI